MGMLMSTPNPFSPLSIETSNPVPISFHPIMSEPVIARMRAPSLAKPIHYERTVTPIVVTKIVGKSSARPIGTIVVQTISSGGGSGRPFTLKNPEAPRKFSRKGQLVVTTWLTKISF